MNNDYDDEHDANDVNGNLAASEDESIETPDTLINNDHHPFYSLTPDTVIDAVESTGVFSDFRIIALNSYENRVYQVGIEDAEPIIAKFYRPNRWSDPQILEEHQFTQELFDAELPVVPANIELKQQTTLLTHGDFRFSLFPRRGGYAPELDNLDHLYQLGQNIGRIHAIASTRDFQHRIKIDFPFYAEDSVTLIKNHFIPRDLKPAYEGVTELLLAELKQQWRLNEELRQIRLHGDCHPGNILWRDDSPHFVDFDDCLMGPAIQDLWMMLNGDRNNQTVQLSEIVDGYNEFHHFDPREIRLIEVLRTFRMLYYCAWLARRWRDPAFPMHFPWFNTERYWSQHILELKEQLSTLQEEPLQLF
ncbi:Ser/Thr protein kinase RdoA (MazF antagonist) [Sinobacterium caligoides]|uniref:Stress response kinase A n=1 Tax=Sinobacterium caligoides TaxID=933926 RepID=A0A3N2DQ74_9GAMM|nr:serine/threonine protein kinase [Sinobacterium caligoides]ROS01940.1 Ser/Thr protein kinase RdoA (MazF antagonist) [Sinobacterium caligoides]